MTAEVTRRRPQPVVIDANVAVALVLTEPDTADAVALQDRAAAGEVTLHAPDTWLAEAANAVWKQTALRGTLSPDRAREAVRRLSGSAVATTVTAVLAERAVALALDRRATVYDTLYLALAAALDAPLATRDGTLTRHARASGVRVYWE